MRAQLSLELLLYVSLAGLSFAFAIAAVSRTWSGLRGSAGYFELSQFAEKINTALLAGGSFEGRVYLPHGLCNSTVDGDSLNTAYGALYFAYAPVAKGDAFCPDGEYAMLNISTYGSIAYFSRD